jgi:Holliday junction DNA helicase RuvA
LIGKLTGILDEADSDHLTIDVGGVGYVVHCGTRTLSQMPASGGRVSLFIETQMSQEQIKLFGFASLEERNWFRLLQSVQGVGAKVALAILSTLPVSELSRAIALGDKTAVARAPGVGPKLAQRIVLELKDKVPAITGAEIIALPVAGRGGARPVGAPAEAVSALINLGYGMSEAQSAVAAALAAHGDEAKVEALIRTGLKEMAR